MTKPAITEQERLDLASKLDRELDEFIDNLPKRKPEESIPFDRWEEEIANHPFFMKEFPSDGSPMHPLYEGLQKLKYDPEENEPEELAIAYKDDGNFNFKHKKYRMAIISYTEGLKAKCDNREVVATLYNNRSAAHFYLKNYRSSLLDAEKSLEFKQDYPKALLRAASCCYFTENYDRCVDFCDQLLKHDKTNKDASELRNKSLLEKKVKERNRRKRDLTQKKLREEEEKIVKEIIRKGIRIEGGAKNLTLSKLEPKFPQLFDSRVNFNSNNNLVWPVIFFYPEYKIMDYIQEFEETDYLFDHLSHIFSSSPEWDKDKKYTPENLHVYFEDNNRRNVQVDVDKTLLEILKLEGHVIKEGTPRFIILVANSTVENLFLAR